MINEFLNELGFILGTYEIRHVHKESKLLLKRVLNKFKQSLRPSDRKKYIAQLNTLLKRINSLKILEEKQEERIIELQCELDALIAVHENQEKLQPLIFPSDLHFNPDLPRNKEWLEQSKTKKKMFIKRDED